MLPDRHVDALDPRQGLGQAAGQRDAAGLQADEDDAVEAVVALDDLVGDAGDGPAQVLGVHHLGPGSENAPVRGRRSAFSFGQCGWLLLSVPASQDRR